MAFWKWAAPVVHQYFPQTKYVQTEGFYRFVNIVKPSLIRVDADELTYPLHIVVRGHEMARGSPLRAGPCAEMGPNHSALS